MQRLRAIEEDWSTINDMRQDFESTKAKLRNLMHRELIPHSQSLPPPNRLHQSVTYGADCSPHHHPEECTSSNSRKMPCERHGGDVAPDMEPCYQNMGAGAAGAVADECAKPYSKWHRYEQRLRAREAEAEAAELRAEVCFVISSTRGCQAASHDMLLAMSGKCMSPHDMHFVQSTCGCTSFWSNLWAQMFTKAVSKPCFGALDRRHVHWHSAITGNFTLGTITCIVSARKSFSTNTMIFHR